MEVDITAVGLQKSTPGLGWLTCGGREELDRDPESFPAVQVI